jgi:hypothetical protein
LAREEVGLLLLRYERYIKSQLFMIKMSVESVVV